MDKKVDMGGSAMSEKNTDWTADDAISALEAIRGEVVPIEGHDDPAAIQDCFNTVFEFLDQCRKGGG